MVLNTFWCKMIFSSLVLLFMASVAYGDCDGNFVPGDSFSTSCSMSRVCNSQSFSRTIKAYSQQWTKIYCCSSDNATDISWWMYNSESDVWDHYDQFRVKIGKSSVELSMAKQILNFYKPSVFQNGLYRCQSRLPDGSSAVHKYHIIFHESTCGGSGFPRVTAPYDNGTVYWNMPGKTSVLPCVVDFGYCPTESKPKIMNVTWMIEKGLLDGRQSLKESKVYKILVNRSLTEISSSLLIQNIQADNYRKFYCQVDDGQRVKITMMELQKGLPGTGELPQVLIIYNAGFWIGLALLVFIIITAISAVPVARYKRLDFLLWRHSRKIEKSDDFLYTRDVFLMHAGTNPLRYGDDNPISDLPFVQNVLYEKLANEYNYSVFTPLRHGDLNKYAVEECIEEMEKSRRFIFLVSERFLNEDLCSTVFAHSIRQEDRATNRNIYVLYEDIREDLWDPEVNEIFEKLESLKANIRNAKESWMEVGKTIKWTERFVVEGDRVMAVDKKSAKEMETFWKNMCLSLPPRKDVLRLKFRPKIHHRTTVDKSSDSSLIGNEGRGGTRV